MRELKIYIVEPHESEVSVSVTFGQQPLIITEVQYRALIDLLNPKTTEPVKPYEHIVSEEDVRLAYWKNVFDR